MLLKSYRPYARPKGEVEIAVYTCPSGNCESAGHMFLLGETQAALKKLESTSPYPSTSLPQDVIRDLITLEIQDQPDHVGPPINILRVGRDGAASWLEGGGVCLAKP